MDTPELFLAKKGIATETNLEEAKIEMLKQYENCVSFLKYYCDFPENYYRFLALWIIATYFFDEFDTFPILFFNATKGSGKTRTSRLVNFLSKNGRGKITNSLTESTFFRHPKGIPMAIDECERVGSKDLSSLREIINSVYKKGMSIPRMKKVKTREGEEYVKEEFEPRFPLTLANIYGMEEVLESRGFTLIFDKSDNQNFINLIEDWERRPDILEFKRTCATVCDVLCVPLRKKNIETAWNSYVKEKYNGNNGIYSLNGYNGYNSTTTDLEQEEFFYQMDKAGIVGRNFELAYPLLITSKIISKELFLEMLEIIRSMTEEKKEEEYSESRDVVLCQYVASLDTFQSFIPLKEMLQEFIKFSGEQDEWINERWLGKALRRLNLIVDKKRTRQGRMYIINVPKAREKIKMFNKDSVQSNKVLLT